MADYGLGVAHGAIVISFDGAGVAQAEASVGKLEARTKSAGLTMAGVGKSMAKSGLVIAAGLGVAVHEASQFQSQMNLLVTAAGESPKAIGAVAEGIKTIAVETGTSLDQLSEGMYTAEKAGFRAANGLNVLRAAAEGAKAENVDLATFTNALTSVMTSYSYKATDATRVTNMLVAASGRSKTTMQEFAGSLATVLPIASALGISFPQVAGALSVLTQHGTSAREATQELANLIRNLAGQNNVASAAMQQLGIDVLDLQKNLGSRGLSGTLAIVSEALLKHGKAGLIVVDSFKHAALATSSLNTMMKTFNGTLAENARGLLSGKTSIKDFQKYAKDLGGTAGASALQFLALYKSSNGFNNALKSGNGNVATLASTLQKALGGATGLRTALQLGAGAAADGTATTRLLAENIKAIGDAGISSGKDISTWAQTQKTASVQMGRMKAAAQVLSVDVGSYLLPVVIKLVHVLISLVSWFGHLSPHMQKMITYSLAVAAAVLLVGGAIIKLVTFTQKLTRAIGDVVKGLAGVVRSISAFISKLLATNVANDSAAASAEESAARQIAAREEIDAAYDRSLANIDAAEAEIAAAQRDAAVAAAGSAGQQEEAALRIERAHAQLALAVESGEADIIAATRAAGEAYGVSATEMEAAAFRVERAQANMALAVETAQMNITTAEADAAIGVGTATVSQEAAAAAVATAHQDAAALVVAAEEEIQAAQTEAAAAVATYATEVEAAMTAVATAHADAAAAVVAADATIETADAEAGAASTLALGPIGVALAGIVGVVGFATHGFGLFSSAAKDAVKPTDDFTNAIKNDSLALGTNTRELVIHSLQQKGAYDAALALGISQKTLTDAAMGNADAIKAVNAAMKANEPLTRSSYGLTDAQVKAKDALYAAIDKVKGSLIDETAILKVNLQAAKNEAAANSEAGRAASAQADALKALPKLQEAVGTSIEALNVLVAKNTAITDVRTAAGRENTAALRKSIDAINAVASGQIAAGVSIGDVNKTIADNVALFEKQTAAAGFSTDAIAALVKQYGLTPKQFVTNFAVNIDKATASAAQIQAVIDSIKQGKIPGLTANSAQGKAIITQLQQRIDGLKQNLPTALEVTPTDAQSKIKALQADINAIKQGKVPGLTADSTKGKLEIQILQAKINALTQPPAKVPPVTVLTADGKKQIADLQAKIDFIKQNKDPDVGVNTLFGRTAILNLQNQINAIKQGKLPVVGVTDHATGVLQGILNRLGAIRGAQVVAKVSEIVDIHNGYKYGGWTGSKTHAAVVHPHEYMLSEDMLAGRQDIDPRVLGILSQYQISAMKSGSASRVGLPASLGNAASSTYPAPHVTTGPTNVRVFIGDTELTDIVRVQVGDTLAPLASYDTSGAI